MMTISIASSSASHFRAHPSAAPLKHPEFSPLYEAGKGFPRSPERGPVEARTSMRRASWRGYFRAHPSAAPLKQFQSLPSLPSLVRFPRSPERGPVEAAQTGVLNGKPCYISALTRARPR